MEGSLCLYSAVHCTIEREYLFLFGLSKLQLHDKQDWAMTAVVLVMTRRRKATDVELDSTMARCIEEET